MRILIWFLSVVLQSSSIRGQSNMAQSRFHTSLKNQKEERKKTEEFQSELFQTISQNLSLKTYGVVNYYSFNWETDPDKRNAVDLERLNMYMKYSFSDKISLKTEFEIEHGGTGVTMEFDKFEEFGEFEQEVENGGEVLLEQLNIVFDIIPWLRKGRDALSFT